MMYKFIIVAYKDAVDERLSWATEIDVYADSSAEALDKARKAYIAPNYMIKQISEVRAVDMYPEAMMAFISKKFGKDGK